MTSTEAIQIRQMRRARVRLIRGRVIGFSVALFLAVWSVITVVLITGHDPALARKASSTATATGSANTAGSTSGSSGSAGSTNGAGSSASGASSSTGSGSSSLGSSTGSGSSGFGSSTGSGSPTAVTSGQS